MDEDNGDISEEVHEDEDELHAWCLLEESENQSSPLKECTGASNSGVHTL